MANKWYASDLHLGHKNIAKYRTDFRDELEHNQFIWVSKIMMLYGDICFSVEAIESVRRLPGRKHLKDLHRAFERVYKVLELRQFKGLLRPLDPMLRYTQNS